MIDQPMVPSALGDGRLVPDALVARADDITTPLSDVNAVAELGAAPITQGVFHGSFAGVPEEQAGFLGVASYPRGALGADVERGIRRHEIMHGYNWAARQGAEGMPFWSRVVGAAPYSVARPLDELVAQRVQGRSFLDIPWHLYANQYAQKGERGAAAVARGLQAAQVAARNAPYIAAGAVGTGMLAYGLSQDDDEVAADDMAELLAYLRENAVAQ